MRPNASKCVQKRGGKRETEREREKERGRVKCKSTYNSFLPFSQRSLSRLVRNILQRCPIQCVVAGCRHHLDPKRRISYSREYLLFKICLPLRDATLHYSRLFLQNYQHTSSFFLFHLRNVLEWIRQAKNTACTPSLTVAIIFSIFFFRLSSRQSTYGVLLILAAYASETYMPH